MFRLIWGLTAWLVHEAIDKIIKEDKNLNALVMLITAGVGLLCNISMGHILHSAVIIQSFTKKFKYDI